MAKPLNPYQGAAPAAMSQMGAGLAEAGANIGRSLQQGYQSLGQGLAGGISAVADAYKKQKDEQARFDATKKMYKAFEGYLPEDQRKSVQGIFDDTSMSIEQKNALAPMLMNMLGQAQTQQFAMQRGAQEQGAAIGRQREAEDAQNWRFWTQQKSAENEPFRRQAASLMTYGSFVPLNSAEYGGGKVPGGISLYDNSPFTFDRHK